MNNYECQRVAEAVSVLANPLRIQIVCLLREAPMSVSQLTEALGAKQPNVSQHLRILYDRGFVARQRQEREVHYRLENPRVLEALRALAEMVGVQTPSD